MALLVVYSLRGRLYLLLGEKHKFLLLALVQEILKVRFGMLNFDECGSIHLKHSVAAILIILEAPEPNYYKLFEFLLYFLVVFISTAHYIGKLNLLSRSRVFLTSF